MKVKQCKWSTDNICTRVPEYLGCTCPLTKKQELCKEYQQTELVYVNYDNLIDAFDKIKEMSTAAGADIIDQLEFYLNKLAEK